MVPARMTTEATMKDENRSNMKLTKEISDLFKQGNDLIENASSMVDAADAAVDAAMERAETDKREARLMELHGYYMQGKAMRLATQMYCLDDGKPCPVKVVAHMFDLGERNARFRTKFYDDITNGNQKLSDFRDAQNLEAIEEIWMVAVGKGKLVGMSPEERAQHNRMRANREAERYREKKEGITGKNGISAEKLAGIEQARYEGKITQKIIADNAVRKLNALAEHADRGEGQEAEKATAQIEKAAEKYGTDVETVKRLAQDEHKQQERHKAYEEMKRKFPREYEEMKRTLEERYDEMPKDRFIVFVMEYIAVGGL